MTDAALSGLQRLRHNRPALVGMALVALFAIPALAAPLLPLADPHLTEPGRRLLPPGSPGHLLGTDRLGRDLLARLAWGTRTSLGVGLVAVLAAALPGTLIGLLAGYFRGWTDSLLMRGIDVLLAFPYLLLALAIVAALGPGLGNAMIAIAVANIPFFARTVRGTVVGLAERDFIAAARLTGAGGARILFRELLPNLLPVVAIMITTSLGWMILETAGLSFLGLGAQPPAADLGSMLGDARELLITAPRVAMLPGTVILFLVIGINLLGDGLRDALDPHLQGSGGPQPAMSAPESARESTDTAAARQAEPLLRVEGLCTDFQGADGSFRVVSDLGFDLEAGERIGLVGESGCGKTVTALSLLGLLPRPAHIAAGRILFQGEDLVRATEQRRRQLRGDRIAYIPQDPMTALNPILRIGSQLTETLRAHQDMRRDRARRRALELLERVRIPEPSQRFPAYPHQLSGGMRQRVAIAMALANDPALIIADEATTALDVTVQARILRLLNGLCSEQGSALLFISHDLTVVRQICHRVLVLYAGQVVEEAPIAVLAARPAHPYSRALLACAPRLGQPDKPLVPIPGQPPPLDDLPPGCRFAARCEHAQDRCHQAEIDLRRLADGRRVRCIRAEELAPWRP
jgi:peptide/nickel transport system permease protein